MSNKELSKVYEFSNVENKWYKAWESNNCFKPNDSEDTFTIMIPPPNVTGILHIGHILNNTIQDVLIRKARMEGKSTLWQPGTDHASIATEAKVTKMLKDKGIDKKVIGRDKFLEHAMSWKEEYGGTILKQLKRMGAKADEHQDGLTIYGGNNLKGCELDSEDDHRIAMSLAIASIMANSNSTLRRSEAAAISYPDFWSDLMRLQQKS